MALAIDITTEAGITRAVRIAAAVLRFKGDEEAAATRRLLDRAGDIARSVREDNRAMPKDTAQADTEA